MLILENSPCLITISTHGSVSIDLGFCKIYRCLGGYAFMLKIDGVQSEKLNDDFYKAYVAAVQAFSEISTPQALKENCHVEEEKDNKG